MSESTDCVPVGMRPKDVNHDAAARQGRRDAAQQDRSRQDASAGRIGEALKLPPATLSFHLSHLTRAGLAQSRQEGRFVFYSADFRNVNALVGYLTENCCGGRSCAPSTAIVAKKGKEHETLPRPRRRA